MSKLKPALIAWDFDGVLNHSFVDGKFLWHKDFEATFGVRSADYADYIFRSGRFNDVLIGKRDILDLLAQWRTHAGVSHTPQAILDFWFSRDTNPDSEVLEWVEASRIRSVIATNNEGRRAGYIWDDMGFQKHVEKMFAAGNMGVRKPDGAFFAQIEAWSGVAPAQILLVDDSEANIKAAHRRGWMAFHFTDATRARLPGILGL